MSDYLLFEFFRIIFYFNQQLIATVFLLNLDLFILQASRENFCTF